MLTRKERYEYMLLTSMMFLMGFILYGALSVTLTISNIPLWDIQSPIISFMIASLLGGYFFFSILSGILFTSRWLSNQTLKRKLLFTIFFMIPVWLSMIGILYSIPYGIYNAIQYRKLKKSQYMKET